MKYDIIVVGSGPGGYVAAIRAAQLGLQGGARGARGAGRRLSQPGCIPTKALLKSAQVYGYCRNAARYGVELASEPTADLAKMVARSRTVAETMSKGVRFLLQKNGIELIAGFGRLAGPGRLEVEGTIFEADHIILATGARPRELPFLPVDGVHVLASHQALTLDRLPASMIVVGSGAIGSEFAWFYTALGVEVTVVEYLPRILPLEDEEVSKAMERAFRKMRIGVLTSTTVKGVTVDAAGLCTVEVEGKKGAETLAAEVVLSAVGIKSNIEGIGLEGGGRAHGARQGGRRCLLPHLGAGRLCHRRHRSGAGAGPRGFGRGDLLRGGDLRARSRTGGLHDDPFVRLYDTRGGIGRLHGAAAAGRGAAYTVGRFPFTASGKATAAGDRDGFVKLLFAAEDGKLLGAHMVGAHVTELLAEPTLARGLGATAHDIARTIHAHPTMNEALMEAAEAAAGEAIHL